MSSSSSSAPRASLTSLPPAVLSLLIPDPAYLHGFKISENGDKFGEKWLAIKQTWERRPHHCADRAYILPGETLQVLKALSQTCRTLRVYALPRLWAVVQVETVRDLGRLRDALRAVPSLAPMIRHFALLWDMNEDYDKVESYGDEHGDVLDMAFIDRGAVWERLRRRCREKITVLGPGKTYGSAQFGFQGEADGLYGTWPEPGHQIPLSIEERCASDDEDDWGRDEEDEERALARHFSDDSDFDDYVDPKDPYGIGRRSYKYTTPSVDREGPDGKDPDRRIHNAKDFRDAVTEIVGRLSNLETFRYFRWDCPVTPIPVPVFASLKSMPNLTAFHLNMTAGRMTIHDLPFWELAPKLKSLSFTNIRFATLQAYRRISAHEEVQEEELTSFEFPEEREAYCHEEREELHYRIFFRTIVAAAKSGRLRALEIPRDNLFEPFAVRKLLPCWVGMEEWGLKEEHQRQPAFEEWIGAAAALRPALAHISFWAPHSAPGPRQIRTLTGAEVQAMCAKFSAEGLPHPAHRVFDPRAGSPPLELYLPWLTQDAALAQQVADAWNVVVERGEPDVIKCMCLQCLDRERALRPHAFSAIHMPVPVYDEDGEITSLGSELRYLPIEPYYSIDGPNYGTGGFPGAEPPPSPYFKPGVKPLFTYCDGHAPESYSDEPILHGPWGPMGPLLDNSGHPTPGDNGWGVGRAP